MRTPRRSRLARRTVAGRALILAGMVLLGGGLGRAVEPPVAPSRNHTPQTPREFYNEGTARMREGKWREAESALQSAVAANEEPVQSTALYNLGHTRFQQGTEVLKDIMQGRDAKGRGDAACATGDQAVRAADAALAENQAAAIARAYRQGRGARKELKAAMEAVRKAMETYGAVLSRWQRASGDFKSAAELQPGFADAHTNAMVVDRHIAALVDQKEMMKMSMDCMSGKKKELKERMDELKKRMPGGEKPEDMEGDDEEEEDKPPKAPEKGQEEKETKQGREMALTYEEALRLLESLKLDGNRKLPIGDKETGTPKDRKGKDW